MPTIGVVAMALLQAGQSYRNASTLRLLETAQVVAQSVDSELEAISRLVLGFAEMRRHAQQHHADAGIINAFIGGDLEVHVLGPDGSVSRPNDDADVARVISEAASSGKVSLSNIIAGRNGAPRVVLAVPHKVDAKTVVIAVLTTSPSELVRSLYRSNVSSGSAILAVTDGTGRIIGRSVDGERFIGRPVPDWKTLVALGTDSGSFRALTIEGNEIVFAFQKISETPGWVAVVGEPVAAFDGRWQRPIYVMLAASSITILVALALALALAQRVLRPISRLASRARAVADSKNPDSSAITVDVPPSFVAEFETLRTSLDEAEDVLRKSLAESQKAELAARESNTALQQAEKLARIGSWSLDLATKHFTCSAMLYELNGADPNGPPLTLADLSRLLAPESLERMNKAVRNCVETGDSYGLEVEHLRDDGPSFPAFVRGQAIRDDNGRIVSIAGTVQDIRESIEQRERLAALADNLPSGVIFRLERSADGELQIPYVSAGTEHLIGIPAAELMSKPAVLLEAIHPEDRDGLLAALEHSRQHGEVLDYNFRLVTRDGRTIWMHNRAALRDQHDGRTIWDGIARDITAEHQAADALHAAKEAAEAAERAKGDFLATMSHEIRTPMNTVIGMTRLALQTNLDPKQRNYLEKINASAAVLLGIINDILDFSRIEAGGLELEGAVFTLESILESVSAVTALKAEEKGLEIAFAVQPGTPSAIKGDSLRLGQVLTNLVGNAVKFTEEGEILVAIAPLPKTDTGPFMLQFSVRDTGVGLTQDQIKGLFRPFAQAGNDTSRKYGGTGLGLAICKRLVEMMGGEIRVESQPGKGSTFIFTAALEPVEDENAPLAAVEQPSNYLRDRRILIVDDNDSARKILAEMVSAFGMVTETAANGYDALNILRTRAAEGRDFDIVLLDWRMPGMDGLETARHIKSDAHLLNMPALLMVTAYGHEVVMKAVEEIGLQGVLLKPVTQSLMFNTVLGILSAASPSSIATKEPSQAAISQAEARGVLAGRRVLVVDDNALNREVATDFLNLVGVAVTTAVDGLDALRKMEQEDFDVVLMDMHMPNMNGLVAVEKIRRHDKWADLPVIALTAQARVEDHRASLEAGMTAHLTKPIDETALYHTLIQVLAGTRELSMSSNSGADHHEYSVSYSIDMDAVGRRFGGNRQRIERLMKGFLRDFRTTPQQIDHAVQNVEFTSIAELAHQIKGAAGYLEGGELCALADRLELAARRNDAITVNSIVPLFRAHLVKCLDTLEQTLAGEPSSESESSSLSTQECLLLLETVEPLIESGDFAAKALLEQVGVALAGSRQLALLRKIQELYDDLELEAAVAALRQLKRDMEGVTKERAAE